MRTVLGKTLVVLGTLAVLAPRLLAEEEPAAIDPKSQVSSLELRRGCAALEGLEAFVGHEDRGVREAAFRALSTVGLRHGALAARARAALTDPCTNVRLAALEALGALGSGEDVPALLERLDDEDGRIRSAALAALVRLTGTRLPPSRARWEAWWDRARVQGRRALSKALDAIEESESACPSVERARREEVLRHGWLDTTLVGASLRAWLDSPCSELRCEAFRLVRGLRLADLERPVRKALPFVDSVTEPHAREALALLDPKPEPIAGG
jgi:hypothetical protein